jgi:hypothetical protein
MAMTLHWIIEIPDSRRLVLQLPEEVPAGHAEIVVQVSTTGAKRPLSTAGNLLRSQYVGMWKDREDLEKDGRIE